MRLSIEQAVNKYTTAVEVYTALLEIAVDETHTAEVREMSRAELAQAKIDMIRAERITMHVIRGERYEYTAEEIAAAIAEADKEAVS